MNEREKAIELVNAYFDGKDIIMKDPSAGVPDWVSVRHPEHWSYLTMFCKNADKYQVVEKPKKQLECKVGDCFYTKEDTSIYLIKTTNFEGNNWFTCDKISIDEEGIDYYDVSYHIDVYSDWKPLDASLYESILALVKSREDAVAKVMEQFDNQIRKLCQELKQNQEK